jgi:osmotically-inducible protein OsmY
MKIKKIKLTLAPLALGLALAWLYPPNAHAQQAMSNPAPGGGAQGPVATTDRSETVEHDRVKTSAEHFYNSPAERAGDDLLITEVKSGLAEQGISDEYPVEVDCDHGTILLSGVVASADDAKQAVSIASNTKGVVAVKNRLTWR